MFGRRKRPTLPPRKPASDLGFEDLASRLLIGLVGIAVSAPATALLFGFRPDAPPDLDPNDPSPPPPPVTFPINLLASGTPMHVWLEVDNQLYQHLDIPFSLLIEFMNIIPQRIIRVPATPHGPLPGDYLEFHPTDTARRFARILWQWRADNLTALRILATHEIPLNATFLNENLHFNPWAALETDGPLSGHAR